MKLSPDPFPSILAIDAGTSALKAVLYDAGGRVLASAARQYTYLTPRTGWGEADPDDWWAALVGAVADLRQAGFNLAPVHVIGLTGQMHTLVLLGEDHRPLAPAILWLDRRAAQETAELQARLGLGPHQLNSTYSLPKLLWLARHQPELLARTRTVLWPKDYLRYRLTGRILTDVTEAAGAALLDWKQQRWAAEWLALANLTPDVLPPLRPATADAGPLLPQVAVDLGLPATATVIVGAGDVIALMGAAPPRAGRLTCSLGSSAMISCPVAPEQSIEDPARRLYIYPFLPYRLLNGVLSTSGASLTWAAQALYGADTPPEEVVGAALAVRPGAESLVYLPYLAGERCPYWNDRLRGGFYGLTLAHNRTHMVRAVLEGVAYSLRHLIDISHELGLPIREIALAGGGAATPGWPQILADVCQRPLLIYVGRETVTRPLYAYCVTVLDPSLSFAGALERTFDEPGTVAPRPETAVVYDPLYDRYRRLADFAAGLES